MKGTDNIVQATHESEEIVHLHWTIWRGNILEAGQEHVFEFNVRITAPDAPVTEDPEWGERTYFDVWIGGVSDSGKMRRRGNGGGFGIR